MFNTRSTLVSLLISIHAAGCAGSTPEADIADSRETTESPAAPKGDTNDSRPPAQLAPQEFAALEQGAAPEAEATDEAESLHTESNQPSPLRAGDQGRSKKAEGKAIGPAAPPPAAPPPAASRDLAREDEPMTKSVPSTENYEHLSENPFLAVADQPLSTFSIDVDTAAYSNVRRMLTEGQSVPRGAVRIEEFVNYFSYDYPNPTGDTPFSVNSEVGAAPWNTKHQLVRIGLQGKRIAPSELPPRNLVFLIDVSGSMSEENKLPLLTRSLASLTETLNERDHVSMVVYAGASGVVLEPTAGNQKQTILDALSRLQAGGSTNGASGIELAYATASRHFRAGGVNRVILATDGDFNVGPSSQSELVSIIEAKRKTGVYLTVLGFGMGNYKDGALEQLADHGNGNYAYIDNFDEARKVLVEEGGSTLVTIAKDVKIQVEFNPRLVGAYRLIGYENRKLENRDFHDDRKDAGEIGAGHNVTALYEIVPPSAVAELPKSEALKYQTPRTAQGSDKELMTVKLRYKLPQQDNSTLLSVPVNAPKAAATGSDDFRFAAAVAAFAMVLRQSEHRGQANLDLVDNLARGALGADRNGRRKEMLDLVRLARKQVPSTPGAALSVAR